MREKRHQRLLAGKANGEGEHIMKNRLLSLLLTVCMVVMLFTGLAVTASAADTIKGYLVSYTFQAGDTMYGVCDAKGIDANTQLNTIARINNITNYNYMLPGKVLWLPSSSVLPPGEEEPVVPEMLTVFE